MTYVRSRTYKNACVQGTLFRQTLQFIHLSFGDGYKKSLHRIPELNEKAVPLVRKIDGCSYGNVVYLGFFKSVGPIPVTFHQHSFHHENKPSSATTQTFNILHNEWGSKVKNKCDLSFALKVQSWIFRLKSCKTAVYTNNYNLNWQHKRLRISFYIK